MKKPWVIIGAVVVVLFGAAVWYSGASSEQNNVGVEITPHVKGNPDAVVSLVEYSDLQCPACATFQEPIAEILESFGDRLRFEYKHFPLPARIHPYAMQASMAAEAAGQQGKFFEYQDLLFANQREWAAAAIPSTYFVKYASDLGLDLDRFKAHLKSSVLRDRIEAELAEGGELGITGTPTFVLNCEKMEFGSYQEFILNVATAVDPSLMIQNTSSTNAAIEELKRIKAAEEANDTGVRFGF